MSDEHCEITISKTSFYARTVFAGKEVPEEGSTCDVVQFVGNLLKNSFGWLIMWIVVILIALIDVLYILVSGKSFFLMWWFTQNPSRIPVNLRVPHIWYKNLPVPQTIGLIIAAAWLQYTASVYIVIAYKRTMPFDIQQQEFVFLAMVLFAGVALYVSYAAYWRRELYPLFYLIRNTSDHLHQGVENFWGFVKVAMHFLKNLTCKKVRYI